MITEKEYLDRARAKQDELGLGVWTDNPPALIASLETDLLEYIMGTDGTAGGGGWSTIWVEGVKSELAKRFLLND